MLSVKNSLLFACALLGAAIATEQAETDLTIETHLTVLEAKNHRDSLPCYNCPKHCLGPCNHRSSCSSSSSSTHCHDTSSSSTSCHPIYSSSSSCSSSSSSSDCESSSSSSCSSSSSSSCSSSSSSSCSSSSSSSCSSSSSSCSSSSDSCSSSYDTCCHELNGLKVVNTRVPFHEAAGVCKSIGMKLADIDIYNFMDATNLAFQCSGPFSKSWIGSYWHNDYCGKALALYTGSAAPGGSINVPACDSERLPVICQATCHHHSSSSSDSCSESSSSSSSSSSHCHRHRHH